MTCPLVADVFVSVDGFAGSDGLPAFFGYGGPELDAWIAAELAVPEVLLFGRRTYDVLPGVADDTRKIVFSSTLTEASWPNTTVARDLLDEVAGAKNSASGRLRTVGSLSIVRQLLAAGLVDRLRLMTFPLLAGPRGREPLFEGAEQAALDLIDSRVLDGRVVLLEYRPTG